MFEEVEHFGVAIGEIIFCHGDRLEQADPEHANARAQLDDMLALKWNSSELTGE